MPDMTDEEAIELEMERQEAATEQDLWDRIANAFDRADKGAEVEAVWPVVEAELALRAGQAEAARDALKAAMRGKVPVDPQDLTEVLDYVWGDSAVRTVSEEAAERLFAALKAFLEAIADDQPTEGETDGR